MFYCSTDEKWHTYSETELYGGMFKHMTRAEFFNLAVYDTDNGHKYVYNKEELVRVLILSGFSKFNQPKMKESTYAELQNLEYRCNSNCIVEAIK
jgi:hypothetical protein